jgi:membrane-associated phospholipid phosphatase
MPYSRLLVGLITLLSTATPVFAQTPVEPASTRTARAPATHEREIWAASGALLVASVVFDERLRSIALANQTPTLDHMTGGADVLGTAGHIVPALVATYVGARFLRKRSFAAATLRVGLSYAAADALESLLKPTVGRERPYIGGEPLTFRLLSANGDFHSFPSAHVVHISSLAAAIATENDRPWVTVLGAAAISYVGAQRVYRNQHWSSDVVASGMLGVEVARTLNRFLRGPHAAR